MPKARIADCKPIQVELEPGRHSWCTCGHSESQPFCDGAHRSCSELRSLKFTVEEPCKAYLCLCKQTKTPPYCDGSHAQLPPDIDEMEVGGGDVPSAK